MDLDASAFLHLQRLSPEARDQDILDFLGSFNFRGDAATTAIGPFSGGEKARLALALVVWQKPNLLVLDEPTNHLDLEMRHAMEIALHAYEGALILVTHDRHLLRNTAEELLLVHDGGVEEYAEDLEGYERWILTSYRAPDRQQHAPGDSSRRERRQQAASLRDKLRPLRRQLAGTEREMEKVDASLRELQEQLGDETLYSSAKKDALADLLRREGKLKVRCTELEDLWLQQQQQLDELSD